MPRLAYSIELAESICSLMLERNETGNVNCLRDICKLDGMPAEGTVYRWLNEHREFGEMYARAREEQAHFVAGDIINIAEAHGTVAINGTVGGDAKAGDTVTLTVNGNTYTATVAAGPNGTFTYSTAVQTSDLEASGRVDASYTATNADGTASATTTATSITLSQPVGVEIGRAHV